jgi:hypothetical protein
MKNPGYAPLLLVRSTRVVIRRAKTPQTRGKDSGTVGLDSSPLVYLTDSRGAIFRSNLLLRDYHRSTPSIDDNLLDANSTELFATSLLVAMAVLTGVWLPLWNPLFSQG